MRVIKPRTLIAFWSRHPETRASLQHWRKVTTEASWTSTNEVQRFFSKAKVLSAERVRFEVAGGSYRLVAAFNFPRQIAYVKFLGTHAEYDRVDALTVSQF